MRTEQGRDASPRSWTTVAVVLAGIALGWVGAGILQWAFALFDHAVLRVQLDLELRVAVLHWLSWFIRLAGFVLLAFANDRRRVPQIAAAADRVRSIAKSLIMYTLSATLIMGAPGPSDELFAEWERYQSSVAPFAIALTLVTVASWVWVLRRRDAHARAVAG